MKNGGFSLIILYRVFFVKKKGDSIYLIESRIATTTKKLPITAFFSKQKLRKFAKIKEISF